MTHGTIAGLVLGDLVAGRDHPWADLYDPSRKTLRACADYAKENHNRAAHSAQWATRGEAKDADAVARGCGAVVRRGLGKVAVSRDDDGSLHERSAVCPHLGCVVGWNDAERTWDCPCHGSRFDRFGSVVNGPACADLSSIDNNNGQKRMPMSTITDDHTQNHPERSGGMMTAASAARETAVLPATLDVVCLCHLRWDFVFQRPQHLMTRFGRERRVFLIEEPVHEHAPSESLRVRREGKVTIATPVLGHDLAEDTRIELIRSRLTRFLAEEDVSEYALWYYTPMMLPTTDHLTPKLVVYDCMDELSAFAGAPPELLARERRLLERADVVFTGGQSLYEAKKGRHPRVHAFPSSIEYEHFASARDGLADPDDQRDLPRPRIGFYGVIDERFDIDLLDGIASRRPDWAFVIIGPTVKIDPARLPRHANIHYLGMKTYAQLPGYLANWDVAMLPFARNDSTRYISPTKTPEYLAAGRPVVSTAITDVVRPYGDDKLVHIADDADGWEDAIEAALAQREDGQWLARVDAFLAHTSWDRTWKGMSRAMADALHARDGKAG